LVARRKIDHFGYVLPCSLHEQNHLLCIHPMLIFGKTAGAAKTQLHALDGDETSYLRNECCLTALLGRLETWRA
jgi:hypothetical protein